MKTLPIIIGGLTDESAERASELMQEKIITDRTIIDVIAFAKLSKLMNSFRSAQCNAPEGFYAEAYSYNKTFPFSDIRNLLPKPMEFKSFDIEGHYGFL